MEKVNDPHLRHLFDGEPLLNVYHKEIINLSAGCPGPDLLKHCSGMMRKATEHRMHEEEKEGKHYLFQYGITAGLWECRKELSAFLSNRYGDPVSMEQLILTCGASHGIQVALNSVISPNGIILVEEVTYMIALDVFKQFPLMKVVTVPFKGETVDLDALERIVIEEKQRRDYFLDREKIFWGLFYAIPTYHNPTGTTLPPESCKRLVEIARANSIVVVCDDVYNLLHYGDGYPPHRLFFYDDPKDSTYTGGNVISNGTFSKILSPGLRVGWIESSPRVVNILRNSGLMKSGGSVNQYLYGIIASLLSLKIEDEHLDRLIEAYRNRLKVICDTLDRNLPRCCSYHRPQGGYFVWIRLPVEIDGARFIKWCQDNYKVSAIPGVRFSSTGQAKNFLRLSLAFHDSETLKIAVQSLCEGLLYYIRNKIDGVDVTCNAISVR